LKFRVEVDGADYGLDLKQNGGSAEYCLTTEKGADARNHVTAASVERVGEDVYSVLLNGRSFRVHLVRGRGHIEAWSGNTRRRISIADARDQAKTASNGADGPLELRAQMPGKVIQHLVKLGAHVKAGDGLMVVEAMKMQNEVKSPRDGVVLKIHVVEGTTVAAGEVLVVIK